MKNYAWEQVVKEVNLVARTLRNVAEVRRKFSDLRVSVKKKAAQDMNYLTGTGKKVLICLGLQCNGK